MTTFVPEPRLLWSERGRDWPHRYLPARPARTEGLPSSADVVVVGAGPAGLAVASALWHLDVRDVVLVDRTGGVCRRFLDRVDTLAQRVLRSPYEHHPGVEGYRDCELLDFARLQWSWLSATERTQIRMAQAGHRSVVPVDVFEAYCRHVASLHGVRERTWRGEVLELRRENGGVAVRTRAGGIRARTVVLCQGEERRLVPEQWCGGGPLPPAFGYWDAPVPGGARSVVVVGAGLTAAHVIGRSLAEGRRVDWVMREQAERFQCSDVNASFFRAEGRARFDGGVPWPDRLSLMGRQRRASVMFEFRPLLEEAERAGRLRVHRGRAVESLAGPGGAAEVALAGGARVRGDYAVLALGTVPSIGERLLSGEIVGTRDGWPDLDERTLAYRRAPEVFAVGAAACMVLGPAARNIDGHRVATARVAATIAARLSAGTGTAAITRGEVEALV
ncbi:hypothetical protein CFN78_17380 [Amycolatopsis antarctica]|uniref:FAD-dependent urate hydroxylase HpyO/Asp monooxygenase CreE-like FAD/NAD(P)-binding domain-containing protein n=1 Tax=Amycolatopsis antarctica TaxID=1854586 RepID=A0A263D0P1_9PSEU|nr:FAD/NAD(P)-binding protein [Amycolatopsis antarctica]OZM71921.1 hypothetical protein CFN78_17380 [Amycolatopsis antarctica]